AWRFERLAREVAGAEMPDQSLIRRILAHPRRIALVDLGASVVFFALGAFRVRTAQSLPIEAGKIAAFGFLSGALFAVLSYCFFEPIIRPLLTTAIGRGAALPAKP